ncbi:bestrophin family protein [Bacteroidota bacterium]
MIRYNPKSWFGLIFQFHRSDTFRQMFWVLVAVAVYSFIIVYLGLYYKEWFDFKSTTAIHSLLGFVIGLLLVFRTNTAYDRWWEGRKQWGSLVNNSRNFALKLNAILPVNDPSTRQFFRLMISNYAFAIKEHLRAGVKFEEHEYSEEINTDLIKNANNVPNAIAREMYSKIHALYKDGTISGDQLIVLDKEIKSFTDILGACERIRNTPIPYSYNLFLKKFIFVYILTMPFGLVSGFNYWTIPVIVFILYVFGSLELLAEEIEDPFGEDTNDLPTDDLAKKIKTNVLEIIQQ